MVLVAMHCLDCGIQIEIDDTQYQLCDSCLGRREERGFWCACRHRADAHREPVIPAGTSHRGSVQRFAECMAPGCDCRGFEPPVA
jgi:hypothetical protein